MKVRLVSNSDPLGIWKFSHGKSYEVKLDDECEAYVVDDNGWRLWIYFNKEKCVLVGAGFEKYEFAQIV